MFNDSGIWDNFTPLGSMYYIDSGWLGDEYCLLLSQAVILANKRQYWLTDHPLFVIFFTKITPFLGQEYQRKNLEG